MCTSGTAKACGYARVRVQGIVKALQSERGQSRKVARDGKASAPVVGDAQRFGNVVASDRTRALDEDVRVLAAVPSRCEEVIEPASEATDGLLHERDGEEVVGDHHCARRGSASVGRSRRDRRDARCMSSAGSPPTGAKSMPWPSTHLRYSAWLAILQW